MSIQETIIMAKPVTVTCRPVEDGIRVTFAGPVAAGKTTLRQKAEKAIEALGGRIVRSGVDERTNSDVLVVRPPAGMNERGVFKTVVHVASSNDLRPLARSLRG